MYNCTFIASKSRVAPIKHLSMPRLELTAALLGARLAKSIQGELTYSISKIVFWSDSMTVLSWVRSSSRNIKGQFVAFRVSEIQDITDINNWRHVPTKMNVADDATRWKIPLDVSIDDPCQLASSLLRIFGIIS